MALKRINKVRIRSLALSLVWRLAANERSGID